eukprot:4744400-Pyramimonas_sp.AAC.1
MASHFEQVLNIQRPLRSEAVEAGLALLQPLDQGRVDFSAPGYDRVLKAIKQLKGRKAAGPDGVPAELYKQPGVVEEAARILTPWVRRWWTGDLTGRPEDWRDSHM